MARRARREFAAAFAVLLAGAWVGQAFLPAVFAGEIAGVVRPAERVKSVTAIDRAGKKTYPATLDAKTGEYRARDLPPGTYDLVLETTAGRIEGVNLCVSEASVVHVSENLKPSELDRDEIARIAARLAEIYAERKKEKIEPAGFWAEVREGKFARAGIYPPRRPNESGHRYHEVALEGDEPAEIGEAILGLMALAKARDRLPRDYDLDIPTAADGPGEIWVTKVTPELTEKDRAWIVDWVGKLKLFENKKRVLDMFGTGESARVLVEKLRDDDAGPTTLPVKEPTAFWRIEIFEFNKRYGGWTKDRSTVVVREQVPIRVFRTYRWMFEKRLGGIFITGRFGYSTGDGVVTLPPYDVPEALDPARGRVPY